MEGRGPTLLLNGHLDTVGVEGMTIEPFAGHLASRNEAPEINGPGPGRVGVRHPTRRVDDLPSELRAARGLDLWGRGSCDMKAGLGALLGATARLAAAPGHRPNLVVALTVDEEHASLGMTNLIQTGLEADMGIVCEPTSLAVAPAHKGFVWASAEFRGVAAHGSRPDLGSDAIRSAGRFLAKLESLHRELANRAPHPLLGVPSFHAGTIRGGSADSVYPAECKLTLERRTVPGETPDDFCRELELRAAELSDEIDIGLGLARPATEVPSDSPLVRDLLACLRQNGMPGRIAPMTAWVDAGLLNEAGIPTVCFGPGDIGFAHSAHERVPLSEIIGCSLVLESFARSLASSE